MSDIDDSRVPGDDGLGPWYEDARKSVQKPGAALQWFGIVSLVATILGVVLFLLGPDWLFRYEYDAKVKMNRDRDPQDREPIPPYDEFVKSQTNQNLIGGLVQMAGSFFIMFGGMKMRQLESYWLAIAGSVLAILPCNCCCCAGAIFGIWSLINLCSADVKLAFARTRPRAIRDRQP